MKIVIQNEQGVVEEIEIAEGAVFSVGRQPDVNDIIINDIKASRKHGKITVAAESITFEDLGSGNGTFQQGKQAGDDATLVTGERLEANTPFTMAIGDAVLIGSTTITLQESSAPEPKPESGPSEIPEGQAGMLECLSGGLAGQSFGLGETAIVLGRIPTCHLRINDGLASRRNSEIVKDGSVYKLKDLGSSNGTFVNDAKITEATLCEGDVLRIGESTFRYSFVAQKDAPPVPVEPQAAAPQTAAPAPAPEGGQTQVVPDKSISMVSVVVGLAVLVGCIVAGMHFLGGDKTPKPDQPDPVDGPDNPTPPEKTSYPVMLGKPKALDMHVTLEKTANVEAASQIVVPFQSGLKVETVHVKDQQRVKKDDPLVSFELTETLKTARTQAQASVASARAEVQKAVRALKNAVDNLKIAQEAFDKNKALYDGGNLVQTEWDKIRKNRNNARTDVDVRQQEKKQADEKVIQAEADVKEVNSKIKDLTVKAKAGGIVNGLDLKKGDSVVPGKDSLTLIEYEKEVKVVAAIPEDDIAKVREGMKATVWLSRAPKVRFEGTVTLIPSAARQRNYDVELKVPNKDRHFRPGAQVLVRFLVETRKGVLALPSAVVIPGKRGGFYVFVCDEKAATASRVPVRRGVETEHEGRTWVEVLPDTTSMRTVKAGDAVVFDGHRSLQDGASVTIKK